MRSLLRFGMATLLLGLCASTVCGQVQNAQPKQIASALAARPPMGWNSWDSYGLTITEAQFRANVAVLAKTLKPFGWNYAVIDEGWFLKNPLERATPGKLAYEIDAKGRYIPVPARFPSALAAGQNTSFAALAASVHAQGLKFGIHIVRGIPRESVAASLPIAGSPFHAQDAADTSDACPWDPTNWGVRDNAAGQAWYDSLIAQYAGWGVDLIKVDCISDHPYKPAEIRMLHRAILKSGRPMVLSLSPGPTSPGIVREIQPYAQMWRISDDVWDFWKSANSFPHSVHDQFVLAAGWAPFAHAGSWPDADMLPLGYLGPVPGYGAARQFNLTHDEQRTMLTLWAIARSPLILGANLTRLDDWTTQLLTNRDVLAVDQFGHNQRQVTTWNDIVVWSSEGKGDVRYLAIFNLNDKEVSVNQTYAFFNLPEAGYQARDLWTHSDLGTGGSVHMTLPPHACVLLELKPQTTPTAPN